MPKKIDDYGFLSDCHSAALVDREGSVDWWCVPRFDSPSVLGRLLGPDAGHWSLCPTAEFETERRYVGDSLVLRTVFTTSAGEVAVTDALGLELGARGHEIGKRSPHVLLRSVEGLRGAVAMTTLLTPRMEYGLTVPHVDVTPGGIEARGGPVRLSFTASIELSSGPGCAEAGFTVHEGERVDLRLSFSPSFAGSSIAEGGDEATLEDTIAAWESWAGLHTGYDGRHAESVRRSSLVLQGLTYQPTGAVVAA
ncbi:MAG: DUF5911 domain-containing protein, partial [Actinomycetota bacterium]|nr:DUF5911 domain-containing protein [Actinomycetota bacterium]